MPSLVERKQTPIGPVAFARGVIEAWKALYGEVPSKETIGVLWGQYMIEGGSTAAIWNYNIGNVKHVAGDGYDWIDLPGTFEGTGANRHVLPEGDPGRLFRAYDSFGQAFKSHLSFLQKRYSNGWSALKAGNPKDFVYAIKAGRDGKVGTNDDYFTGDLDQYTNAVVINYKNFVKGTYYEDALKQLSIVLGTVGKPLPEQQAPVLPAGQSHSESGAHTTGSSPGAEPIVTWPIIHKSPFDEEK